MKKVILLAILILLAISNAHLEGESQVIGNYKIELSIVPEDLMIGKNSDIVISVENATTGDRIPQTKLWVRLSLNDIAIFSSSDIITNQFGSSDLNIVFQKPGHYKLEVSPRNTNSTATFHLRVLEEYKEPVSVPLYMAATAALFFIVGIAIGFIFSRRRRT